MIFSWKNCVKIVCNDSDGIEFHYVNADKYSTNKSKALFVYLGRTSFEN